MELAFGIRMVVLRYKVLVEECQELSIFAYSEYVEEEEECPQERGQPKARRQPWSASWVPQTAAAPASLLFSLRIQEGC